MPTLDSPSLLSVFDAFPALWLGLVVSILSWTILAKSTIAFVTKKGEPPYSWEVLLLCGCASAFFFLTLIFLSSHVA